MRRLYTAIVVVFSMLVVSSSYAGMEDRSSNITLKKHPDDYILMPDVGTPSTALTGTPSAGWAFLYMDGDSLKFTGDDGVRHSIGPLRHPVPLGGLFVDGVGPITSTSAPNLTTVNSVPAVRWDNSAEKTKVTFQFYPTKGFKGLKINIWASSTGATGTQHAVDWAIRVQKDGQPYGSEVAQTGASFTETHMDVEMDKVTVTLNAAGIADITGGSDLVDISIWNDGTSNYTLDVKGIELDEL